MNYHIVRIHMSEAALEKLAALPGDAVSSMYEPYSGRHIDWHSDEEYGSTSQPLARPGLAFAAVEAVLAQNGVPFDVKDETAEYLFFFTDAPRAYDGFSTLHIAILGKSKLHPDRDVRLIAVKPRDENWQRMRYSSGLHASFPAGDWNPWDVKV